MKSHYHIVATLIFIVAILAAHYYATKDYNWLQHTISDLGAQGYEYNIIMRSGFVAFGILMLIGIIWNGLSWNNAAILVYALCVGLSGIYCTKPFYSDQLYNLSEANLHSSFAQVAGVAFSVGILVQMFFERNPTLKYIHLLFFMLVIGFSLLFGIVGKYQGVMQRLLYLVSFIWLLKYYKS